MYQDQDSIKVFERLHARDRARELAQHIGDSSPDDIDVFGGHARAERAEGRVSIILSVVTIAALLGLVAFFWQ